MSDRAGPPANPIHSVQEGAVVMQGAAIAAAVTTTKAAIGFIERSMLPRWREWIFLVYNRKEYTWTTTATPRQRKQTSQCSRQSSRQTSRRSRQTSRSGKTG